MQVKRVGENLPLMCQLTVMISLLIRHLINDGETGPESIYNYVISNGSFRYENQIDATSYCHCQIVNAEL